MQDCLVERVEVGIGALLFGILPAVVVEGTFVLHFQVSTGISKGKIKMIRSRMLLSFKGDQKKDSLSLKLSSKLSLKEEKITESIQKHFHLSTHGIPVDRCGPDQGAMSHHFLGKSKVVVSSILALVIKGEESESVQIDHGKAILSIESRDHLPGIAARARATHDDERISFERFTLHRQFPEQFFVERRVDLLLLIEAI